MNAQTNLTLFWPSNLFTSTIDTVLDAENVTLHTVMDEDDVLQECKAQNKKLIDYLVRPEIMDEMVTLVTEDPTEDVDEKIRYKYPNTACELLTSDVPQITDLLTSNETLLAKVYSFLETDQPLNPLLASFFSKILGLLIHKKSDTMFEYLSTRKDFVGSLLHHLGTSAIMDLMLRVISNQQYTPVSEVAYAGNSPYLAWLDSQNIIQKLVALIDPGQPEDKNCNASKALCDIVTISRENQHHHQDTAQSDPLLETIESPETISNLLDHMLDGEKTDPVLSNGLALLQTLLEYKRFVPEGCTDQTTTIDADRQAKGVHNTLMALTPRLHDLNDILTNPPEQHYSAMLTTIGWLEPPLGNPRLQLARLVSTLLSTNTHSVNLELVKLKTMDTLLDLFFKYLWNNFLHTQVEICVSLVLVNSPEDSSQEENKESPLLRHLFKECKLVQRIVDKWEESDDIQAKGGHRQGFMGHLTKIALDVVDNSEKGCNAEYIQMYLKELPDDYGEKWTSFVTGSLAETLKKNTLDSVGPLQSSSEDDDADFRDIPFPQDTAMQQAFSDYQLQQMTSNFIDQFGFREEDFAEQDEATDDPFKNRITSIDFSVSTDGDDGNANSAFEQSAFEQVCNEKIRHFDDPDSDEDLWENKQIVFANSTIDSKQCNVSTVSSTSHSAGDSQSDTDSDEEDLDSPAVIRQTAPPENMDVDSSDAWPSSSNDVNMDAPTVAMDTAVPNSWVESSSPPGDSEEANWANFGDALPNDDKSWADFNNFTPLAAERTDRCPRSSSPMNVDTTDPTRPSSYVVKQPSPPSSDIVDTTTGELGQEIHKGGPVNTLKQDKAQNSESREVKSDRLPESTTDDAEQVPVTSSQEVTSPQQQVTSSQVVVTSSDEESPNNDPKSESNGNGEQNTGTKSESEFNDFTCNPQPHSSTNQTSMAPKGAPLPSAQDTEDDLSDNFDFLASAGLMKSDAKSIQNNDLTSLEQSRANSQEALDHYTTAVGQGDSSSNGPV